MWRLFKAGADTGRLAAGQHLLLVLFLLLLAMLACNLTDNQQPTALPEVTESDLTPEQAPPSQVVPRVVTGPAPTGEAPGLATVGPSPASPTTAPQATATLAGTQPVSPATPPSPAGVERLQPGQSDANSLAGGGSRLYPFQGTRFEPLLFFAEGDAGLDLTLTAYEGAQSPGDLAGLTPISEADLGPAGRPEMLVFTPEVDGIYTLVVQSAAGSGGQYTLYLYDSSTPAPGAQLVSDTLQSGQSKDYPAQSAGSRPVIVFVDPANQEDLAIEASDPSGEVVTTADFGGGGSAEALYLLPIQTTSFTIIVRETGGAPAGFNLVIITLS